MRAAPRTVALLSWRPRRLGARAAAPPSGIALPARPSGYRRPSCRSWWLRSHAT